MLTKQQIIEEIKRTAKENGGKPLGVARFEKETSIRPHEWGKYWARFGDAQREAGFVSNELNSAYTNEFLMEKIIRLIRKLNKFTTLREITVEKNTDSEFPTKTPFQRLGNQYELSKKIIDYCKDRNGYDDIIKICETMLEKNNKQESFENYDGKENLGEVYLFKSGKYYKIGKTNDTVRRGSELRTQLPENLDLIHSIKTDDPSGVETYWHRRFEPKRMNGEWFDLKPSDIKAFKRWRRIY